jgi:hypothetical protein
LQIRFFLKREELFTAKTQRSRRKANDFDELKLLMKGFLGALRVFAVQRLLILSYFSGKVFSPQRHGDAEGDFYFITDYQEQSVLYSDYSG